MLPTYTALFEAHRWLCLTRRIRYGEHELHDAQIAIARARLLAATLAAGNEDDEPPALLLALLLEAGALGEARSAFPVVAVRHLLRSRCLALTLDFADRIELRAIRDRALAARDARGSLHPAFDEARAFVAARLRRRE
jgi:hypothetical protein